MTTPLPYADVPGCRDATDRVDPACRQCGRGTWLEPDGAPALVCAECAAAGWWLREGEAAPRHCPVCAAHWAGDPPLDDDELAEARAAHRVCPQCAEIAEPTEFIGAARRSADHQRQLARAYGRTADRLRASEHAEARRLACAYDTAADGHVKCADDLDRAAQRCSYEYLASDSRERERANRRIADRLRASGHAATCGLAPAYDRAADEYAEAAAKLERMAEAPEPSS